jgi:hypothetical protein
VLLLHSFGPHVPPWNDIAAGFHEELIRDSPHPIDLYEAAHQLERSTQPPNDGALLHYLHELLYKGGLDLTIAARLRHHASSMCRLSSLNRRPQPNALALVLNRSNV